MYGYLSLLTELAQFLENDDVRIVIVNSNAHTHHTDTNIGKYRIHTFLPYLCYQLHDQARLPYVHLCPNCDGIRTSSSDCPAGRACPDYHLYVRPATAEIILKIYPISTGKKSKELPGGAILKGDTLRTYIHISPVYYTCIHTYDNLQQQAM